jgi:2-polyprenyl-6-methoxyphenol hydroxylase-like FAD-dependent oxidoreductase
MTIQGSRVGIVGGSIAGCAAAIALHRVGCDLTVYERSPGDLQERGFGVAIPVRLREELVEEGFLAASTPIHRFSERLWVVRDAAVPEGRVLWRQPFVACTSNWSILWQTLRAALPDESYLQEVAVTHIDAASDGVTIVSGADRPADRFDAVVGADGYQSTARTLVAPGARPEYAGYALWRGSYPESRLADRVPAELEDAAVTICFPGGHGLFYLIPNPDHEMRAVNWGIYHTPPRHTPVDGPMSLASPTTRDALTTVLEQILTEHFPARWAEIVRHTAGHELFVQPIYDVTVARCVSDRLMLVGDAATVARPHTAAGATKALEDALALNRACRRHRTWDRVLAAYDEERCAAGNALVALGRRLGQAQVEDTPRWDSMTPADFDTWMRATLAGARSLYDRP